MFLTLPAPGLISLMSANSTYFFFYLTEQLKGNGAPHHCILSCGKLSRFMPRYFQFVFVPSTSIGRKILNVLRAQRWVQLQDNAERRRRQRRRRRVSKFVELDWPWMLFTRTHTMTRHLHERAVTVPLPRLGNPPYSLRLHRNAKTIFWLE